MTPKEREVFFQVHSGLPREGPGSWRSTQKAFASIPGLSVKPRMLDIGCGPGAQTIHLSEVSKGEIYALDNHKPYIERLKQAVQQKQLTGRVFPLLGDMHALSFGHECFDLLWTECCIYIIGLEKGLEQWQPVPKKNGYIAFTEISWLRDDLPEELEHFWKEAYPTISSVENNRKIIGQAGYQHICDFVLPESDWWDEYYGPIEKKLIQMKAVSRDDPEAMGVLELEEKEMDLYRRYAGYYGYVFYISKKNG